MVKHSSRGAQRGAYTILTVFVLSMSLGALGVLAVGHTAWEKNRVQGLADMVALTAARQMSDGPDFPEARALALENGLIETDEIQIECIANGEPTAICNNAITARVTLTRPVFSLLPFLPAGSTTVIAEATTAPTVVGTISSGLASVNTEQSILLNALLTSLGGGAVSLDVLDYQGLLGSDVQVDLLGLGLELDGLTFNELLALKDVRALDLMLAALSVGDRQDAVSLALLNNELKLALKDVKLDVADVLAVDLSGRSDTLLKANFGEFAQVVLLNAVKGNVVNLQLPVNALGIDVELKLVEAPQLFVGRKDPFKSPIVEAKTAQVALKVAVDGNLGGVGSALLGAKVLDLGIQLRAGGGLAEVNELDCRFPRANNTAKMTVVPAALDLCVMDSGSSMVTNVDGNNCPSSAKVVDLPLLGTSVSARAGASLRSDPEEVVFEGVAPFSQTVEMGLGSSLSNLMRNLELNLQVRLLGGFLNTLIDGLLNLLLLPLKPILAGVLGSVGTVLDGLLEVLGVNLNEVTVNVNSMDCQSVVLTR